MHLHRQQILHKTPRQGVTEAGNTYYMDTDTDTGYRILQQILHVYYCTGAGYIEDGFPPVELDVTWGVSCPPQLCYFNIYTRCHTDRLPDRYRILQQILHLYYWTQGVSEHSQGAQRHRDVVQDVMQQHHQQILHPRQGVTESGTTYKTVTQRYKFKNLKCPTLDSPKRTLKIKTLRHSSTQQIHSHYRQPHLNRFKYGSSDESTGGRPGYCGASVQEGDTLIHGEGSVSS